MWTIGSLEILKRPLMGLVCSRRCPGDVILKIYDLARSFRDNGIAVISGFHTPMEKEFLDLILRGNHPIVICPARSIVNMRLSKPWRRAISESRLLILSPFPEKYRRMTAALANERNILVAEISHSFFIPYAEPGSQTESLCRAISASGKTIFTFKLNVCSRLVEIGAKPVSLSQIATLKT